MESSLYNPRLEPQEPQPAPPQEERRPPWRRILGWLGAGALVAFKFAAKLKGLLLLLPKIKILSTSGTMLVSVAAYALIWGWRFALGFVLLLLRARDGARDPAAARGDPRQRADVHPLHRRASWR